MANTHDVTRSVTFTGIWNGYGPPTQHSIGLVTVGKSKYTDHQGRDAIYFKAGCREGYMDQDTAATLALAILRVLTKLVTPENTHMLRLMSDRRDAAVNLATAHSIEVTDAGVLAYAADGTLIYDVDPRRWQTSLVPTTAGSLKLKPDADKVNGEVPMAEYSAHVATLAQQAQLPNDHLLRELYTKAMQTLATAGTRGVRALSPAEAEEQLKADLKEVTT